MRYKNKFLFDNQLLIQNLFLPQGDLTDKEVHFLYADGSKEKSVKFFFTETSSLQPISFIKKLEEVDYRDTYYDQPFLYHSQIIDLIISSVMIQQ